MTTTTARIAELLMIPEGFVVELCQAGIVVLDSELPDDLTLEPVVERVRISWTLHEELGVNLAGVEVALNLLALIQRDRSLLVQD